MIHLHVHNEFSILDGVGKTSHFAEIAKEAGQGHLALTNHGNVDGALAHQRQCIEAGITPLIGCELYVVPDISIKNKGEKRYHAVVLVENQTGWQNLLKMLTIANLEGFYHRPRVDPDIILENLEGLLLLTGCTMSIINMPGGVRFVRRVAKMIGKDRVFLEVMPHDYPDQIKLNNKIKELSAKLDIGMVATNDCHYPTSEASKYQEVLLAVQTKKKWNDKTRWRFDLDGLYLKTGDEMEESFVSQKCLDSKEIRRAIRNTKKISKLCEGFRIEKQEVDLPSIKEFAGTFTQEECETDFLKSLVLGGKLSRVPVLDDIEEQVYSNRIKSELALIDNMGFHKYFLIVWDLVNWCREKDIMVGPGRGSVGGSLVAYLLGITDVDPIKFDLVFFRFISPDRKDLPDIDLDFEHHKRHLVREYLEKKYGKDNVAGISTFTTMKGRGVFRDIARVFDISLEKTDQVAKAIDDQVSGNNQIKEAFSTNKQCIHFKKAHPEIVATSEYLEGQTRGVGQHAAAICLSASPLTDGSKCSLAIRNKQVVVNWDKDDSEFMGLMKLDVLGLSALSILNECRKMVKKNHDVDVVFNNLELNDRRVFRKINSGNTTGAFQIGTKGLSNYCQELAVDNFELLSAATALFRPGPLHSGMAELFVKRKHGKAPIEKIHKTYDKITKDTLGIIVYQEQVMLVINELSGIPMDVCNLIRKVMGKSKGVAALNKYREQFLAGCHKERTVTEKKAQEIWETIATFGEYGFNKAHSVEYSIITYWDMWLKTYYPHEFMACCLTFGKKENHKSYTLECRRLGMELKLPKIGISDATRWTVDKGKNLYAPFVSINGVAENVAEKIVLGKPAKRRNAGFFGRPSPRTIEGVNASTIDILEKMKAFDIDQDVTEQEKRKLRNLFSF